MSKPKPSSLFADFDQKPIKAAKSNQPVAKKRATTGFQSTQDLLTRYTTVELNKHVSREFQDFGYRLAVALNDLEHKSLYIKMAKTYNRGILEQALAFVVDANAKNKARLFMWKVAQLKQAK